MGGARWWFGCSMDHHVLVPSKTRYRKIQIIGSKYFGAITAFQVRHRASDSSLWLYMGMQPEPVSTARSPSFWPGPARRSLGPGWHGTGLQAVLGPHFRPEGRHGPARQITTLYKITHFDI